MSTALETLQDLSSTGEYLFYGSPLSFDQLDEVDEWRSPIAAEIECSFAVTGADLTYPVSIR